MSDTVGCGIEISLLQIHGVSMLAHYVAGVSGNCSDPPPPCETGTLISFPGGVCEAPETMGVMTVVRESGFDMSLGDMAYCWNLDIDYLPFSSNWFQYKVDMS